MFCDATHVFAYRILKNANIDYNISFGTLLKGSSYIQQDAETCAQQKNNIFSKPT